MLYMCSFLLGDSNPDSLDADCFIAVFTKKRRPWTSAQAIGLSTCSPSTWKDFSHGLLCLDQLVERRIFTSSVPIAYHPVIILHIILTLVSLSTCRMCQKAPPGVGWTEDVSFKVMGIWGQYCCGLISVLRVVPLPLGYYYGVGTTGIAISVLSHMWLRSRWTPIKTTTQAGKKVNICVFVYKTSKNRLCYRHLTLSELYSSTSL